MDNNGEPWDWNRDDYCLQNSSNFDASTNQEDHSHMLNETTPIKDLEDFASYHIADSESVIKEREEYRESSLQAKRRRMLQFSNADIDHDQPLYDMGMSSVFLKSKEIEYATEEVVPEVSHWSSGLTEDASGSINEGLDPSTEGWLAECFNDAEFIHLKNSSDVLIDISDLCNTSTEYEANTVQDLVTRTPPKIVFKGKKSYIQTPTKLASSIVSPFAFIKPCGVNGDTTLNDINQRIRVPPQAKSKKNDEDDLCASYPTSAFSGKPVVGKTKINIEGGKGSITIMRTKG